MYSLADVAIHFHVHDQTVKRWYYDDLLPGQLVGHTLIFLKADVAAFVPPGRKALMPDGQDRHIAAFLLHESGKKMTEIAEMLGYAGESGVSKAVKYGREKLRKAGKHKKKVTT